jgi:hypothetical protein
MGTTRITVHSGRITATANYCPLECEANSSLGDYQMATITVHAGGSIQTAINSAANGDTIFIENGTYREQISIAGRTGLILQGQSDTGVIIKTPVALLAQNATDATTGRLQDALIAVSASSNITIENLKVDGADRGNDVAGGNDFVGIAVANSTGTIHDVDVSGIRDALVGGEVSGNQRGNAIVISNTVGSPHSFTVSDSSIENYQKTAIIARNTTVTLTNNDIDGGGPHSGIAQNGIQLSSGSTGSVTGNHIEGLGYTGNNSVVGLFVFDSHGTVTVSGNTFDGTTANDIFAYVSSSSGVTVSGNTINNSDQGVIDTGTITTPNDIANNTYNHVDNPYSFDPDTASTTPYNIHGTPGDDYLHGGAGNDHIDGAGGSDTVDMSAAGAGGAFVNLTSGIAVSGATGIDTLVSIENIIGSAGNDQLIGDGSANTFFASGGSDTIDGRGGSDTFDASSATGSVVIDLDSGFVGGAVTATLTSIENAVGGSGADFIAGGTGPNALSGNGGNDTFLNLHDGDVVHGGPGLDTAVFSGSSATASLVPGPNGTTIVTQNGETVTIDSVDRLQFTDHTILIVGAGGYATIQAAVNAAQAGDTIVISGGSYVENVNVPTNGLTIESASGATVIVTGTGGFGAAIALASGVTGTTIKSGDGHADHFVLQGAPSGELAALYLAGNNDHTTISAITATAAPVGGGGGHNALLTGGGEDHITIQNSVFGGPAAQLVYFNGFESVGQQNTDINLLNNTFQGTAGLLVGIEASSGTISGNTFSGTSSTALGLAEAGMTVTGNTFSGPTQDVYFGGDGSYNPATIVANNSFPHGDIYVQGKDGVYATLQDAVDAAAAGDTIIAAAGIYSGDVNVNKQLTIVGAQHGVAGPNHSGAESVIHGGLFITADGVGIDGLEITGAVQADGTDLPNGIVVAADNVTIENSVLDGSTTTESRPFSAVAGTEGLSVTGNAISHWAEGAYLTVGTTGSIDHNSFAHNGNGVVTESVNTQIANNSFQDSAGAHIVPLPFVSTSIGSFVHDNTFLDQARPISVYANGPAGQTINGSDVAETFHGEYVAGPLTINAGGGGDSVIGSAGNDIITGGAGSDTIDGAGGIDTAVYATALAAADVTFAAGKWTVHAGAEGVETLSNVEIVDGGGLGGARMLLVGGDGFSTIQSAINAAHAGDTILVAAGTYNENLTVNVDGLTVKALGNAVVPARSRATMASPTAA